MLQVRFPVNGIAVGVDLHKDHMVICVLNTATGEVRHVRIACKCRGQIVEFFKGLAHPHVVAIESVGFYRWLWDLLWPIVDKLVLADASMCRQLAGRRPKTDEDDSLIIAELLACGRLPLAFAPDPQTLALKDLTRYRNFVSRSHSRVAVRVRSLMNQVNRPGPRTLDHSSLSRYIKAQEDKLPARHVEMMWMAVEQMIVLCRQLGVIERQIEGLVSQPPFARLSQLLQSVPGVGPVVSATFIAELGGDPLRFDRKTIAKYAGLCPRSFRSDTKQRNGRICKTGPRDLRWVLGQAAWVAVRTRPAFKRRYTMLKKRRGWKSAIVAIARHLLLVMWSVARRGQDYRPAELLAGRGKVGARSPHSPLAPRGECPPEGLGARNADGCVAAR